MPVRVDEIPVQIDSGELCKLKQRIVTLEDALREATRLLAMNMDNNNDEDSEPLVRFLSVLNG